MTYRTEKIIQSCLQTEEVAQSTEHLLGKHEALSLNLRDHIESQVWLCTLAISALRRQKIKDPLKLTGQPVWPIGKVWIPPKYCIKKQGEHQS